MNVMSFLFSVLISFAFVSVTFAKDFPDGTGTQAPGVVILQSGVGPVTSANPLPITSAPGGYSVAPITSASSEASHVLKASAGSLISLSITTGASAGYLMVFNAASVPADGAVTPSYCWPVSSSNFLSSSWLVPVGFSTGITVVFSTTGCFTKTGSATAFFSGQVN